jgi:hypothetical protein
MIRAVLVAVCVAVAVGVEACGGDSDGPSPSSASRTSAGLAEPASPPITTESSGAVLCGLVTGKMIRAFPPLECTEAVSAAAAILASGSASAAGWQCGAFESGAMFCNSDGPGDYETATLFISRNEH